MIRKQKIKPWIYILPALLLLLIILVFPIMYTGYISLTNMNMYHWNDYKFIGVFNYIRALFKFDSGFLEALLTTILWTAINMILQIGMGFLIALGLNSPLLKRLSRIYKTLLMLPWAMPAYISILLWRVGMFNTEFGILNKLLTLLGLSKVDFLGNNIIAFCSCLTLNLWMALPFMISTIDGALHSIDSSLYESAILDGAGFWESTYCITIPAIKPIIAPAAVMTTFITFKQFDIVYLLTQQRGYMTGANLNTVITYAHQNAFVSNNYGLSGAVSILLFVIIILFSIITNRSL
ncbi:ABC transporter, permease protein [Catonella morbi ATCC 51271]|uniref:ABC transporter, permease protein n=1 Tax=Catonella morbi ATCC 51271 TaxID=592026 RepID=V2Y2C8_9FIRM|nr:sugar ABC transporter permease [Catonella morbi]ESL03108.1 ABC transporter, permease protein [Catonella morbi ATCC 51271]